MKHYRTNGRLILEEINFSDCYKRTVSKNNKTSGKVTLPLDLVGKKVYVVIQEGS